MMGIADCNEHVINMMYCIYHFRNFNHVSLALWLVKLLYALRISS